MQTSSPDYQRQLDYQLCLSILREGRRDHQRSETERVSMLRVQGGVSRKRESCRSRFIGLRSQIIPKNNVVAPSFAGARRGVIPAMATTFSITSEDNITNNYQL